MCQFTEEPETNYFRETGKDSDPNYFHRQIPAATATWSWKDGRDTHKLFVGCRCWNTRQTNKYISMCIRIRPARYLHIRVLVLFVLYNCDLLTSFQPCGRYILWKTGNALSEDVKTGTATQNVTAGNVRSSRFKQMVCRSRGGLVWAVLCCARLIVAMRRHGSPIKGEKTKMQFNQILFMSC